MAFLRGFGSYVPSRVVTNSELAERLGCEAGWILDVSGIGERRYAADSETVVDLGVAAARACLDRAGLDRASFDPAGIGLVILASGSAERRFPGPAAETAARLGLAGVPVIDLPMASAGALFGLEMAHRLCGAFGPVLLIAAEKMSAVIAREPQDRNTAVLFGDGAGACLIHPSEGSAQIVDACLHTDGGFANDLCLDWGQPLHMDGRSVIMQASRKVPAVIRELLERNQQAVESVDTFLLHQANQNLTSRIAKALEVPLEKFYSNIAKYGNTSSASMLIAASEWYAASEWSASGGFRPAQPVVFAAFGAGFNWGALLAVGA